MNIESLNNNVRVAVVAVLIILCLSLLTNYFARNYNVQYTSWFTNTANRLVDKAENAANWGSQDTNNIMALQDLTESLTIIDTLTMIVPVDELTKICQVNVGEFQALVFDKRQKIIKELYKN